MPTTITIHAPELTGESNLSLYLRTLAGALVNDGGDELTEDPSASGLFAASVSEDLSAVGLLHARVHDPAGVVRDGWLPQGATLVQDGYPATIEVGDVTVNVDLSEVEAQLDLIQQRTAYLTSGRRPQVVSPVSEGGQIDLTTGYDYTGDDALDLDIDDAGGVLYDLLTAAGVADVLFGASLERRATSLIAGTVTDITHSDGITTLTIEVHHSQISTEAPFSELYEYQIARLMTATGPDGLPLRHLVITGRLTLRRRTLTI